MLPVTPLALSVKTCPCGMEHSNIREYCDPCATLRYLIAERKTDTSRQVLDMTFAAFKRRPGTEKAEQRVKEWFARVIAGERPRGFALKGPVGSGKTHLMRAIWNALIFELPYAKSFVQRVKFIKEESWFDDLKRAMDPDSEISRPVMIEQAQQAPVLFWDDLGTKQRGDKGWADELMYLVFDARFESDRTTIISTNIDLTKPTDAISEKVRDRIVGLMRDRDTNRIRVLPMVATSYRSNGASQ